MASTNQIIGVTDKFSAPLDKLNKKTKQNESFNESIKTIIPTLKKASNETSDNSKKVKSLTSSVAKGVIAYASFNAIVGQTKGLINAGIELQRIESKMNFASGSAEKGAVNFQYVREEAERLGLSIGESANGFAKLLASTEPAGISLAHTKQLFLGASEASTTMGLSVDETNGIFLALSQVASKGKVSMEEIGQIGERLTGTLPIASRALGLTTKEFIKLVSSGKLMSEDFLPKFGIELRKTFAQDAVKSAHNAQQEFNRLNNSLFELRTAVAESGFLEFVTDMTQEFTKLLRASKPFFDLMKSNKEQERLSEIYITDAKDLKNLDDLNEKVKFLTHAIIEAHEVQNIFDERKFAKELNEAFEMIEKLTEANKVVTIDVQVGVGKKPNFDEHIEKAFNQEFAKELVIPYTFDEKPLDIFQASIKDMINDGSVSEEFGVALSQGVTDSQDTFKSAMAGSIAGAVTEGLTKGDFSGFGSALGDSVSSAMASALATSLGGLSGGQLAGVGVGAFVLSELLSNDKKVKIDFADQASQRFDNFIKAINKNTESLNAQGRDIEAENIKIEGLQDRKNSLELLDKKRDDILKTIDGQFNKKQFKESGLTSGEVSDYIYYGDFSAGGLTRNERTFEKTQEHDLNEVNKALGESINQTIDTFSDLSNSFLDSSQKANIASDVFSKSLGKQGIGIDISKFVDIVGKASVPIATLNNEIEQGLKTEEDLIKLISSLNDQFGLSDGELRSMLDTASESPTLFGDLTNALQEANEEAENFTDSMKNFASTSKSSIGSLVNDFQRLIDKNITFAQPSGGGINALQDTYDIEYAEAVTARNNLDKNDPQSLINLEKEQSEFAEIAQILIDETKKSGASSPEAVAKVNSILSDIGSEKEYLVNVDRNIQLSIKDILHNIEINTKTPPKVTIYTNPNASTESVEDAERSGNLYALENQQPTVSGKYLK